MRHIKLSFGDMKRTSEEERLEAIRIHAECSRLGIRLGTLSDTKTFSSDEIEALRLINANKKIPADLEKRLLEKKAQNNTKYIPGENINITDEEIAEFLK